MIARIWTIARKELAHGQNTMLLYIFAIAMMIAFSYPIFWSFGPTNVFLNKSADLRFMMSLFPYVLMVFVPAFAMRTWSEERRLGTLELTLTYPMPVRDLVLGKFVGNLLPLWASLLGTLVVPVLVDQVGQLDWGPVWGGYAAACLLSATCLAICMCVSALTEHQIIAFIVGFLLLAFFTLFFVSQGNFQLRFANIARGLIDSRDMVYFICVTLAALAINIHLVESQWWRTAK